jgi:hypothetical protein
MNLGFNRADAPREARCRRGRTAPASGFFGKCFSKKARIVAILLCVIAIVSTVSAESPLPTYTQGQDVNHPLDANEINAAQFAALRLLALERDHGGNPPPLPFDFSGTLLKKALGNARELIYSDVFGSMRNEFDRASAKDRLDSAIGPALDNAKSVRFLLVDIGAGRLGEYDFDNQSFKLRPWKTTMWRDERGALILPDAPAWYEDDQGMGLHIVIPIPEEQAAKWRNEDGQLLAVCEIGDIKIGGEVNHPAVGVGTDFNAKLGLLRRKYIFRTAASGVIAEVPAEQTKLFSLNGLPVDPATGMEIKPPEGLTSRNVVGGFSITLAAAALLWIFRSKLRLIPFRRS